MSSRVLSVLCGAMVLSGCAMGPAYLVNRGEVLARCKSIEQEGRLDKLVDPYQAWVQRCERVFGADSSAESSKRRVRLALEFWSFDRRAQANLRPVTWEVLEPAVRQDVQLLSQATQDSEGLLLLSRWSMEVTGDPDKAVELACTKVAPDRFDGQLLCGDYLQKMGRRMAEVTARWVAAFPLAGDRAEQCQVVDRITDHSLTPEHDQAGMSPTVLADCQQRRQEQRQLNLVAMIREAAKDLQDAADAVENARKSSPPPPAQTAEQK